MMKYEIEKRDFGSTWVHVLGKNAKQETMTIEIVKIQEVKIHYLMHGIKMVGLIK